VGGGGGGDDDDGDDDDDDDDVIEASDLGDLNSVTDEQLQKWVSESLVKHRIQFLLRKSSSAEAVKALVKLVPRQALVDYVRCLRKEQVAYQLGCDYDLSEDLMVKGQQVYLHLFRLKVVDARRLATRILSNSKADQKKELFESKFCKFWAKKVQATIRTDKLSDQDLMFFRYVGLIFANTKNAAERFEEHQDGSGGAPLIRMLLLCGFEPSLQCTPFSVAQIKAVQAELKGEVGNVVHIAEAVAAAIFGAHCGELGLMFSGDGLGNVHDVANFAFQLRLNCHDLVHAKGRAMQDGPKAAQQQHTD